MLNRILKQMLAFLEVKETGNTGIVHFFVQGANIPGHLGKW